ncbi:MAG: hypothetical protein L0H81_05840 [Actinomyces sp.]|nr:hypothetical protein [Actinomyces sp.]MDN6429775.1 hypothetical protein [Propionibacterium sp.]MDN6795231.1 hypothetical protein [Propionibacterium sp.]
MPDAAPDLPDMSTLPAPTPPASFLQQRAALAATSGAVTLAWYALPDVVRRRRLRAVLKTALLAVLLIPRAGELRRVGEEVCDSLSALATNAPTTSEVPSTDGHPAPGPTGLATDADRDDAPRPSRGWPRIAAWAVLPLTVLGVGVWGAIEFEGWLFRRGERRRTEGHRHTHLRQALPLAAATALLDLVPDPAPESTAGTPLVRPTGGASTDGQDHS